MDAALQGRQVGVHPVRLVEDLEHRLVQEAQGGQDVVHRGHLLQKTGIAQVDDVDEEVGLLQLFQGGLEGLQQVLGADP